MIHFYCGDGKGKTTAAMGLAVRAAGRGKRVFIVQFLKSTPSGEVMFFENTPAITLCRGKAGPGFTFNMSDEDMRETRRIHDENMQRGMQAVRDGECDLLVLDEVGDAYSLDLLDKDALLTFLAEYGARAEIVMTGHKPIDALVDAADYVTVMQKQKHPYDKGVNARVGVEF